MTRRVVILGYGIEGRSAAAYFAGLGDEVTIADVDSALAIPVGFESKLGPDYLNNLDGFDVAVRSPGIRPDAFRTTARVTSAIIEFMDKCPAPIIGVTGTKGKGTTSTLIARILEAAGKTVWLGGNIGTSPLDFLPQVKPDHYVVLELSSFQLIDAHVSPQVAVCLMLAPDHLNWHTDMDEYLTAKGNIFAHQSRLDLAVYNADDDRSVKLSLKSPAKRLGYGSPAAAHVTDNVIMMGDKLVMKVSQVGLLGPHNLQNICAAITAVWDIIDTNREAVSSAVSSFTGLEHRLELAARIEGVGYYDDSFSTTPETAIAAIRSFAEPKVIILGGSDKGADYAELARVVENEGVIHAFLIGDTAPAIERALRAAGFAHITVGYESMDKLVRNCYAITEPGDVVLLSTGCASFGLFTDYKDRGNRFKAAVRMLEEASGASK